MVDCARMCDGGCSEVRRATAALPLLSATLRLRTMARAGGAPDTADAEKLQAELANKLRNRKVRTLVIRILGREQPQVQVESNCILRFLRNKIF